MPARLLNGDVLARLERFYDAVPRSGARAENHGPFTLFVSTGRWPFYARPRLGLTSGVRPDDVEAMRERQGQLGVPEAFEWVVDTTPSLSGAAQHAGLKVDELPLLVLGTFRAAPPPTDIRIRRIRSDEPDLARMRAVAEVAFAHGGTGVGPQGAVERDKHVSADPRDTADLRGRIESGRTVFYVAEDAEGPLASGAHQPVDQVTEIVAVATLPSARRRGLGAAITAALVGDALAAGIDTIFLSASSDDVARVYERLGFDRIGHAGLASPLEVTPDA